MKEAKKLSRIFLSSAQQYSVSIRQGIPTSAMSDTSLNHQVYRLADDLELT
jgi:hypothetical protein